MMLLNKFRPDFFFDTVYDIKADWLAEKGLRGLIVDVDNTILARDATEPTRELRTWVAGLVEAGVSVLLVSNNWSARVRKIAEELDVSLIAPALKPTKASFKKAKAKLGLTGDQLAIVGDQLFTDILGGNRARIATILVIPVGRFDLVHTKALRVFEKLLLFSLSGRERVDGHWRNSARGSNSGGQESLKDD